VQAKGAPPQARTLLLEALLDRGRLSEATAELDALAPDDPQLREEVGESLLDCYLNGAEEPYLDGALTAYDGSIEKGGGSVSNLCGRGAALLLRGDPEAAIQSLNRAVELDQDDALSHVWLALALRRSGDTAGAESHRVRALTLQGDIVDCLPDERLSPEKDWLKEGK